MEISFRAQKGPLEQLMAKLDALSPLRVLERGYSLVRDPSINGVVVRSAEQVRSGQELQITFYDGQRMVQAL